MVLANQASTLAYVANAFRLRPAVLGDAEGMAAVQVATWKVSYPGIIDQGYLDALTVESKAAVFRKLIEQGVDYRIVAVIDDRIVGFATSGIRKQEPHFGKWYLYSLHVHPDCQGIGIGRALIEDTQQEGRQHGSKTLTFDVLTANEPAKKFYERLGAIKVGPGVYELEGVAYPTDYYEFTL